MKTARLVVGLMLLGVVVGCTQCKSTVVEPHVPEIRFASDKTAFESESNAVFEFEVKLDAATEKTVTVNYETEDITAVSGEDYTAVDGTLTFAPGETSKTIEVEIVVDEFLEGNDQFKVKLSTPINSYLKGNIQEAIGTINNDDSNLDIGDNGYTSADSYAGMSLVWSDEFDQPEIELSNWTYDLGGGGWGNQELQTYTSNSENSYIQDGKLVIMALDDGGQYTSARLKSVDLQEYQFGRIDIRAKLPVDQGLWPAIWALGANYSEIGWPACGEIDIMELVGSNPRRIHGTIHWGNNFQQHQSDGQGVSIDFPDTFADEYHVFSIEWQNNSIKWLLDDVEYHSIDNTTTSGQNYPFNEPFFFILNVAVGGQWPGDPDDTTTFPEFMAVDYIRVFQ